VFFLPDVIGEFIRISQKNILGMEEYIRDVSRNVTVKIIEGDATKDNGIEPDSVDLIVTSPRMVTAEQP
jgi:DNA modification methylase